jgi:hypothetical protein
VSRLVVGAVLAAAVLSGLALSAADAPAEKAGPGYGIEIKLAPKESAAGQFVCEATVTDLSTGKVISAPRVEFLQGKSGTTISDDESGKREVLLTVGVEGNATRAAYTVEVREGGSLVSSQKGSVKLR